MKKLALVLFMFLAASSGCSDAFMEYPAQPIDADLPNAINETTQVGPVDTQEEAVDPSTVYPFPNNSCVQCQWYFCPPLDSVWQK